MTGSQNSWNKSGKKSQCIPDVSRDIGLNSEHSDNVKVNSGTG